MNDITQPLVLSVGSHRKGSGRGCAMNVISWENGDSTITDFPSCSDPFLAKMVQRINDNICTHTFPTPVGLTSQGVTLSVRALCSECSVKVLDLAHRTVGTHLHNRPAQETAHITIALERAQALAVPGEDSIVKRARALVQDWLYGRVHDDWTYGSVREQLTAHCGMLQSTFVLTPNITAYPYKLQVAKAEHGPASTEMRKMQYDSASSANYALEAVRQTFQVFGDAFTYAEEAATCGVTSGGELDHAHKVIDRFEELTGVSVIS